MGRTPLIVDAGPLVAVFDTRDRRHRVSRALLESHPGPLVVPSLVIAEVAYLVRTRLGARAEVLLAANLADGRLLCEPVAPADWMRMAELSARYADLPLGLADASLVTAAERLGITDVATFDAHLRAVRPTHADVLNVLP